MQVNSLDLDGGLLCLALLLRARDSLLAHDASTPVALRLFIFLRVAFLDGRDELGQLGLVLGADFSQGEHGGGL